MGEMSSLWGFLENQDMEQLGQKLLCTTLELEKLKAEAVGEMSKNNEYIKHLTLLLKYTLHERDEARNQLHSLLHGGAAAAPPPPPPPFSPGPVFLDGVKPNSAVSDCNSPSDAAVNRRSHSSSPVDSSFFDGAVPSPGISNINLIGGAAAAAADVHEVNRRVLVNEFDHASLIIDGIVKGRALPETGRFLQAVLHAGPLLQTLLVAGPLPRWRNPPQILALQVPPVVGVAPSDAAAFTIKSGQTPRKPVNSPAGCGQLSCGTAQAHAAAHLFNSTNSGSGLTSGFGPGPCFTSTSGMNYSGYNSMGKRQRLV
ncbi:uncharacterized protein LOC127253557 [Andrographis paniculata]|uniref:uncharacterized protein LOC127253557 n=1 Tax=Andrographis paniculata TaxID=175694 RepID=UPI0021E7899F|nr:uncharacterized protein LOC127253557 [Andrographis paniculata]